MTCLKKLVKWFIYKCFSHKIIQLFRKKYFLFRLKSQKIFNDEEELLILPKIIKPDDIVVDIGANIGVYTIFISRLLSDTGCILSFEPIPDTCDILRNNVKKLCCKKAKVFQLALTDNKGTVEMVVPKDENGVENFYLSHIQQISANSVNYNSLEINAETLDNILEENGSRVDFIKCDAEGAELLVFQGSKASIKKFLPTIMCEISGGHKKYGYTTEDVFNFFWDRDYYSYILKNNALVKCNGFQRGFPNYFFIHSTKIETVFLVSNNSSL